MSTEKCGTYAGWNHHNRAGEMACQDCLDSVAAYARARRTRTERRSRQVSVGFPLTTPLRDFDGIGATIARAWRESA